MNKIKTRLVIEKRGGVIIYSEFIFNKTTIGFYKDVLDIYINEIPCNFTIKDIRWVNKALKS